jgi:ABC-type transporter Mla subunit MlaD
MGNSYIMRLGAIITVILVFFSCHHHNKNRLTILFDNVERLNEGSSVYCKGVVVGEVTKFNVNVPDDQVAVDIELIDSIRLPAESRFIINSSVIGSAHITIVPSMQTAFLSPNDTVIGIYSKEQFFDDLVSDTTKRRKVKELVGRFFEEMGLRDSVGEVKNNSTNKPKFVGQAYHKQ